MNNITEYLEELFPNPQCELVYNKDYELVIAVVLSAQTTDKNVNKVTSVLFEKYPSLKALKEASLGDLEGILKPIGMYHKKAKFVKEIATILHDKYNDTIIYDRKMLESLPGVGRKTANVILAILFNEPCLAVDTHVSRIAKRLGLADKEDSVYKIEKKLTKLIKKERLAKSHYQLVLFGRYHCTAINPRCMNCKLRGICKYEKKHL